MPDDNGQGQGTQNGAQQQGNNGQQGQQGQQQNGGTPDTWDAWIATLPEDQRTTVTTLQTTREAGLKSALEKERQSKEDLERQLRESAKKLEKGSEAETQLTQMADKLAAANRATDFYRDAAKPEVGLADPEAAWLIVQAKGDEFLDRKGNVNFTLLKERHPSLFAQPKPTPKGNAGSGTGQDGAGKADMNMAIRRMAGRG